MSIALLKVIKYYYCCLNLKMILVLNVCVLWHSCVYMRYCTCSVFINWTLGQLFKLEGDWGIECLCLVALLYIYEIMFLLYLWFVSWNGVGFYFSKVQSWHVIYHLWKQGIKVDKWGRINTIQVFVGKFHLIWNLTLSYFTDYWLVCGNAFFYVLISFNGCCFKL